MISPSLCGFTRRKPRMPGRHIRETTELTESIWKSMLNNQRSTFMSDDFQSYCREENIEHILIATSMPRGNGQVERVNRIIIFILTKLSHDYPGKWFKYIEYKQRSIVLTKEAWELARSKSSSMLKCREKIWNYYHLSN